jgi:peptidoglycan/LPS O-acetylase OafA/YrhL
VAGASTGWGQGDGTASQRSDGKPGHFRPDIEGLRAIAILAVLLFHVGVPFTEGGFTGVDVFYVISGFLITGLLLREGGETGKVDLIRFYARRMRRLLPAALLVIVATLAMSAVVVTPLRLSEIAGDAAAAAFYVANFRFALDATNYLAVEAPSPLLHYWSLAVEEQFYLVWPLLLLLATRVFSLRWVGLFLLILGAGSFALSLYWTDANPEWAFFSPVTRAWELAAGALIAIGLLRIPHRAPRWLGSIAVILGLALIVAGVVFITEELPFPGVVALMPVLGAVLVIVGGLGGQTLPARIVLGNPVSRYLGRISYSLYLWHWPLLILVPISIGSDTLSVRLGLAVVAIIIAAISTELVEQPFRGSSTLTRRNVFSVELGLSGSVAVGVAALFLSGAITLPSIIPAPTLRPAIVGELQGVRNDLPSHYPGQAGRPCHVLDYKEKKLRTDCVYGDPNGKTTAMLIGDSHAAQWMPALDAYAAEEGWRLEVHTKGACPVVDVPVWERDLRRTFEECMDWRKSLLKRVRKTEPDVVFVGLARDYELYDGRIVQSRQALGYWQDKLTELLTTLGKRAGRVVLLAETPFLNYDPVDCLADQDIANCDPAKIVVVDRAYLELEQAAAEATGAQLLSVTDIVCPDDTCPVVVSDGPDEYVVFRDNHHLTASYMEHLAEPIGRMLEGRPPYPPPSPSPAPDIAVS